MTAGIPRISRRVEGLGGRELAVVEWDGGEGALPVLMLHGFTGSVDAWEELPGALARGTEGRQGRRVVAVDLPGHGASDPAPGDGSYGVERLLDELEAVLDTLEIDEAAWIGYSMGGRVALAAGVLRPDRVGALVLESASPGLGDQQERLARRMDDEALARRLEQSGPEGMEAFVNDWMDLSLFSSQGRLPEERLREARARRMASNPVGLAAALRAFGTGRQPSFWDRLGAISAHTLLVTGGLDEKFDSIARRMEPVLRRGAHRSVRDSGHAVHFERPDVWLEAVGSFLAELPDGG